MNRALWVAVILIGVTLVGSSRSANTPSDFAPVAVARGRALNQTGPISATTIYTPPSDGLYRLSVYATTSKPQSGSQNVWSYLLFWTDDAGPEESFNILNWYNGANPPLAWGYAPTASWPGTTVILEAVRGTPITYQIQGTPDGSAYSFYYTLERIN